MEKQEKIYQCGTLTYTRPALAVLFFWLLWGDFCYMLMETVTPSIMPLKFKYLHASNTEIGLIITTIPGIVYTVLNPVISFKSDRFRSRWGRRIPFILVTLPFLVLCLIGLGFGDRIGMWLRVHLGAAGRSVSPQTAAILTIGVLLVAFTFFNTFVTSTFWYLFNDVVPEHLLARFMSWFRIISMLASALYNFFIFQFAGTHSTAILVGAAILYLVGFGLMCLNVREGQYPPPPPYLGGSTGPIAAIKTYGKECHAFSHYWYLWLSTFTSALAGGTAAFALFFFLAIGLNLQQIGYVNGTISLVVGVLILLSGWLADRYHPIRVVLIGAIVQLFIVTPASMIWLFWHPTPDVAFTVSMIMGIGLTAPAAALLGVWDPPMLMRLFPRDQYGQFCSTNAIWRSIGAILGGAMAGVFLDIITHWVGKKHAYFYIPVWQFVFSLPSLWFLIMLYRSWKRHGGDAGYLPPMLRNPVPWPATPEPLPMETGFRV